MPEARRGRLGELARVFLKLGATSFGGPAVHVALLEDEVVARRKWLTRQEFLDLLGATNLIPGPNSTEMAIHVGLRRAGWPGLLVAGACFILPAFLIATLCGWFYLRYSQLPQLQGALYAVKPVVLAIVAQAIWRLAGTAIRGPRAAAVATVALVACLLGAHELLVLLAAGAAVPLLSRFGGTRALALVTSTWLSVGAAAPLATAPAAVGLWPIFGFFLKVGAVLYGSGYVLLAFLRADLVERWSWLTETQLLDAIAIGQILPGPLFTTAAFIGVQLGGFAGACAATAGIFLPAFVFVAISAPFVHRMRSSPVAAAFLNGVNAASLALMTAVLLQLAGTALTDALTIGLALVAAVGLLAARLNPIWLILGAAAIGLAL